MSLQRVLVYAVIGLAVLGAIIIILQVWGVLVSALSFKILATIGILILLAGFLLAVRQDFSEHKRLKDENFLD